MNKWLDYGGFLIVLYTMLYVVNLGKQPDWFNLFLGAFGLVTIGIGIEIYKRIKTNE